MSEAPSNAKKSFLTVKSPKQNYIDKSRRKPTFDPVKYVAEKQEKL